MSVAIPNHGGTRFDFQRIAGLLSGASPSQHYVFLLSHMRSYSSLLSHLLGSSPEVDGYGETMVKYKRRSDLWRLNRQVRRSIGSRPSGRYLLDKILHNFIRAPYRIVPMERVHAIMFVRRPEPVIRSILTLGIAQHTPVEQNNPQYVCDYYVSRLHRLRQDSEALGKRALYFDAEWLVENPLRVLDGIAQWLQLERPLSSDYQVRSRTGEIGFGDPLHNIHAGKILDASHSTVDDGITLPPSVLTEAEAAYQRCRESLLRNCSQL
jgi:hypothetical protein